MMKSWILPPLLILASNLTGSAADKVATPLVPSTLDFRLGPEDVLDVFVWKEPDLSTAVTVRPDGKISLPLAGELDASGKTAIQMQDEITQKLQQYIKQPVVTVIVKQINS